MLTPDQWFFSFFLFFCYKCSSMILYRTISLTVSKLPRKETIFKRLWKKPIAFLHFKCKSKRFCVCVWFSSLYFFKEKERMYFLANLQYKRFDKSVIEISREQTLQSVKNLMQISFTAFQILHTNHGNQFFTAQELFLNGITINPCGTN